MLAAIRSAAVIGIDAYDVTVEVDASKGLPQWTIVGLAAHAVKESRERVSAALANTGFVLPPRRYTINLAPADQRKEGTAYDLPIALGVLVATEQLDPDALQGMAALGELGLDGSLRGVRGVLPVAMRLAATPDGPKHLIVPPANADEALRVSGVSVWTPETLVDLVQRLRGDPSRRGARLAAIAGRRGVRPPVADSRDVVDISDVSGQETAKRGLEIAAAGGHALLMIGPPGAGKTMLARRLPTILPSLTEQEALEVLTVHSVAGTLSARDTNVLRRPFRAPHHSLSAAALVGGGSTPRPGEVSLAHHGVLFLDELQEMSRSVLDTLRQPMEDGQVVIARAQMTVTFPSRFALVGAMNPCPCGFAGDTTRRCNCAALDIAKHRARVSGPLADRIDMTLAIPAVAIGALASGARGPESNAIRERVEEARARQTARYGTARSNAQTPGRWIESNAAIEADGKRMLIDASVRLGLSARGYHRTLKVAQTIADLDASGSINRAHVAEALFFRSGEQLPSSTRAP